MIGIITIGGDEFIAGIKGRNDIEVIEVTNENRDELPDSVLRKISG
ncbi:MAG: hypothetical protein JW969_06155 [Spirochaetales bacterium]|nr:hypothetical protein [Spirochaetales bacterium]